MNAYLEAEISRTVWLRFCMFICMGLWWSNSHYVPHFTAASNFLTKAQADLCARR